MSFSRHRKYRLPTKTKTHAMCPRRVRMTIVGFVRFLSKYSSVIAVSKATLNPRTFSNPRKGKIAFVLFERNLLSSWIAVDARFCEIFLSCLQPMWPYYSKLGLVVSVCEEGSMCNDIYPG